MLYAHKIFLQTMHFIPQFPTNIFVNGQTIRRGDPDHLVRLSIFLCLMAKQLSSNRSRYNICHHRKFLLSHVCTVAARVPIIIKWFKKLLNAKSAVRVLLLFEDSLRSKSSSGIVIRFRTPRQVPAPERPTLSNRHDNTTQPMAGHVLDCN